jgi:hypothetical protein
MRYEKAVNFRREGDRVLLDNPPWPERIGISQAVIDDADPRYIVVGEGVVEFFLDDAYAMYRVNSTGDVWDCSLL